MAGSCICKCAIGIINSLFLLVGLILMAIGGILIGITNNTFFASTLLDIIKTALNQFANLTGNEGDFLNNVDFVALLQPAALAIFFSGAIITCIAVLGYCGISCYNVILKVYLVIVIVILVIQIIIVALFFSGALDGQIRTQVTNVIDHHFVGIEDFSIYSLIPNTIMIKVGCCGIDSWEDFNSSVSWQREKYLLNNKVNQSVVLQTPVACCVTDGPDPITDPNCAIHPNANISNYEKGCWNEVETKFEPYRVYTILICCAVILIQLLIIGGVLCIVCDNDD